MFLTGGTAAPVLMVLAADGGAALSASVAGTVATVASTTAGATALGAATAGATAVASSAGAIGTAAVAGAAGGLVTGGGAVAGAVGAATAVAVDTAIVAGSAAVASGTAAATGVSTACAILSGPIGWAVLGADGDAATFDCWKDVLRDYSDPAPSRGRPLAEVLTDKRVELCVALAVEDRLPRFAVRNAWQEVFDVYPVMLPCGAAAYHAQRMSDAFCVA